MEAIRENVTASSRVYANTSKCQAETSVIVPDKKPDILKILQADASCAVTKKTLQKGRMSVEGKVYVTVLYLPDTEEKGIKSINAEFEFEDVIDAGMLDEGMHAVVFCDVEQADINLINSRKINIRAVVGLSAEVTADKQISYLSAAVGDDIASRSSNADLYSIIAEDSCEFLMKEQVELMAGKPCIAEILKIDAQIEDKEIRTVTDKIILKGNVCANILYQSENNTIEHAQARLPFTEVFEIGENCEADKADVWCCIMEKSCRAELDSDGDSRVLGLEILVGAQVCVRREKQIEYLSDCYFYGANTVCQREEISTQKITQQPVSVKNVRESITFDKRMPRAEAVYNVVAKPHILSTERMGDGIDISARLDVCILYLSDTRENPVCCYKTEIPIIHSVKSERDVPVSVTAECEHMSYSLNSAGDVEIRAAVAFRTEECEECKLNMICNVEKEEMKGGSELVIFFSKGGEDIWDIAKRFRVSCEEIAELNGIEPDGRIEPNRRLIIPCM